MFTRLTNSNLLNFCYEFCFRFLLFMCSIYSLALARSRQPLHVAVLKSSKTAAIYYHLKVLAHIVRRAYSHSQNHAKVRTHRPSRPTMLSVATGTGRTLGDAFKTQLPNSAAT